MTPDLAWHDDKRAELRQILQSAILGELRLAKYGHEKILELCREVYVPMDCPDQEIEEFVAFAADVLRREHARLESDKVKWPNVTDCDRLDRVEAALREKGILFWQASPCCDTCTGSDLLERIEVINRRFPDFGKRVRGYAFFIDQNMPDCLAESPLIKICLAYGWFAQDEGMIAPIEYEKHARSIGREVCECLRIEGFKPEWNGDYNRKIVVSIKWQRRTLLE